MLAKTVVVCSIAAVVVTIAGCSSDEAPAEPPMTLVEFLRAKNQLQCERSFTCCIGKDAESSTAKSARMGATSPEGCASLPDGPGGWISMQKPLDDAIQRGSLEFHGDQATACLAAQRVMPCADYFSISALPPVPAACVGLLHGKLPLGAACVLWQECPTGAGCLPTPTGSTCQKIPALGEPCTGYCPDSYWCDPSSSKCAEPKPEGASCKHGGPIQCQGACDPDTNTCGPPIHISPACVGG